MNRGFVLAVVLLLLIVPLLPFSAVKAAQPPSLNMVQEQAIVYAYRIGGMRLAAIVYQESSGCVILRGKVDHLALGCAGLHQQTANNVPFYHATVWSLQHDFRLNIDIAERVLAECTNAFGFYGGITCYWSGIPVAQAMGRYKRLHSGYLAIIRQRMMELQDIPVDTE